LSQILNEDSISYELKLLTSELPRSKSRAALHALT
jgi:hypothetical protein